MPDNPLADRHEAMGALLMERAGTRTPKHYREPVGEHLAARSTVAIFDLASAGRLFVRGSERLRFLHGLLTADIASLEPGDGCLTLLLDRHGRIASEMRVVVLDDAVLLLTPSLTRAKVLHALERYRASTDVEFSDASERLTMLSVQGPQSFGVMGIAAGVEIPGVPAFGSVPILTRKHGDLLAVNSPRGGEIGLDLLVPTEHALSFFDALLAAAARRGGRAAGLDAFDTLRIEVGHPTYGREIDETTLPEEVGLLERLVDLERGAFLGSDAIRARQGEGLVRRLCGLQLVGDGAAPVSQDKVLVDGRPAGRITSACLSPTLGHNLALAMLEAWASAPGTAVVTDDGETGTVVDLPFWSPTRAAAAPPSSPSG